MASPASRRYAGKRKGSDRAPHPSSRPLNAPAWVRRCASAGLILSGARRQQPRWRRHGRSHHAASPKRPAPVSHTAAISPPRLASLGSGPDRPLLGLFKSSSGTLGMFVSVVAATALRLSIRTLRAFSCHVPSCGHNHNADQWVIRMRSAH
jgi:hypothetical protein